MNRERDKFLTEAVGECWHTTSTSKKVGIDTYYYCQCGISTYVSDFWEDQTVVFRQKLDFSTPDCFFKLWNWSKDQAWWEEFLNTTMLLWLALLIRTRLQMQFINL